jgi:hypothetical protein
VASGAHDSEQESVQRMSHVAPAAHDALPLGPSVSTQVAPAAHATLQEAPQLPLHSLSIAQLSVQLSPAQPEPSRSQAAPAAQAHDVPVHVGGGVESPPQALAIATTRLRASSWCIRPGGASLAPARARGQVGDGRPAGRARCA